MEYVKTKEDAFYALRVAVAASLVRDGLFHYRNFEDFVLQEGKWYPPKRLPFNYRRRVVGKCFNNAYELSERYDLTYVEGFGVLSTGLVHHAWNLDKKGNVIDTTWEDLWNLPEYEPPDKPIGYIGVEIPFETVTLATELHGYYGVFDDVPHRFPILHLKWFPRVYHKYLETLEVIEHD